jgi:hypothetical protein
MGIALPVLALEETALRGDQTLFFTSDKLDRDDPAANVFKLTGERRIIDRCPLNPYRGAVVIRLTPKEPFGGFPTYVSIDPGPPGVRVRCGGAWPQNDKKEEDKTKLACSMTITLRFAPDGNALETVAGGTTIAPGQDLCAVWTWSGVRHQIFLNGKLAATVIAKSPFPREILSAFRILDGPDLAKAPVHEIAIYNFPFSAEQVTQDLAQFDAKPFQPMAPSVPTLVAQWGPGEKKVYYALDTGNAWADREATCRFVAVNAKGETADLGTGTPRDGFFEAVAPIEKLVAGTWRVKATLTGKAGAKAEVQSDAWEFPAAPWIGNTLGITDKIQPPWTPIETEGLKLKVWGREYDLTGGFGLPQQITSQGRKWLARPVELKTAFGDKPLAWQKAAVRIDEKKPGRVTWTGTAEAEGAKLTVRGSLEYDGMMLFEVALTPTAKRAGVYKDDIRLIMTMPKERALFLNTTTDQGYWWHPFKGWIPETPGLILDNLKQKAGKTTFLFFATFSDHDTGLEWFADNSAGWQIDEAKPCQEVLREPKGEVSFVCRLVNERRVPEEGMRLTFGLDGTPVKPLPSDWRNLYCYHHALAATKTDLAIWYLWSHPTYDTFRPSLMRLRPDDLKGYAAAIRHPTNMDVKMVPFTNQHVLIPAVPDRQGKDEGWGAFQNLLEAETENTGWNAVPSRSLRDYWAWNLDQWLKSGGMDGIYIDEANAQTTGLSLLSGAGYLKPDGTHGIGHNTLGMREQLKRVRQLFLDNGKVYLDHGKQPLIWIPVYGMVMPHAFAFTDIWSEGEAFMFEKPEDPDFVDMWGRNLLDPNVSKDGVPGGPWLLSTCEAQKYGAIPLFLNFVKFFNKPEYLPAMRAQFAVLGLLDMIPINPELGWIFKAKQDFGMSVPETTFHRWFEQKEAKTSRSDVVASYYRRDNRILCIVSNLGNDRYDGGIKLDLAALGLKAGQMHASSIDSSKAERLNTEIQREDLPFATDGASLKLAIPRHDFRMILIDAGQK